MQFDKFSRVDESSKTPKYLQVVETVISDIKAGIFRTGEKIPSINETSMEFYLSRDTVEKAYKLLQDQGYIVPVKGKGYFVASSESFRNTKVLLLINRVSEEKKTIYNSFIKRLGDKYEIDIRIHQCDHIEMDRIIIKSLGQYDYYIIMPFCDINSKSTVDVLNMIPKDKLIFLHKAVEGVTGNYASIYEDFENDIDEVLTSVIERLKKYRKFYLVIPTSQSYLIEIEHGFSIFFEKHHIEYEIPETLDLSKIQPGDAYIVFDESEMINLIKNCEKKKYKLGQDVGLISYNSSPFKELLSHGVSVMSTDFKKMGITAASFVKNESWGKVKNPYSLTLRNTL